jgi:hypothetical protein
MRARGITIAALLMTMALAACEGSIKEAMIARGFSPAYAEGYDHGCSSGRAEAGSLTASGAKDTTRYGGDADYTKGWDEGYTTCKAQETAMVQEARRRNPSREK